MDINTAIMQRRTIRRFKQDPVSQEVLCELVRLSRLYASGGNLQPIRYTVTANKELLDDVFATLRWAAYLPEFTISENERPAAYVVLTSDAKRNCQFDVGAAATTLMLAAEGKGLGTCCLGSFDKKQLVRILDIPAEQEPLLVIALGYPAQCSQAVDMIDDVKYYENEAGCLCVPKRTVGEILRIC